MENRSLEISQIQNSLAALLPFCLPSERGLLESYLSETKHRWHLLARPNQLPPAGDWAIWVIMAGRGFGKTRAGAEWVRAQVEAGARRIALVARTPYDARDVMVEGESGILAISRSDNRPRYEPSKRRLTWPNGAQATTYSAEEPDQLRGPQHDAAWGDECASWENVDALSNLMFGLRLGQQPRAMFTTTPKPGRLLKELLAMPHVVVTRGSTYENLANLAPTFRDQIIARYEGTRLGRQELAGELLEDVEGALWQLAMFDAEGFRVPTPERATLSRVVVAIDPATTASETSDETGIIVAGKDHAGAGYVLEDLSGRYSPNEWALKAVAAFDRWQADRVVIETNQGGQMATGTLRTRRDDLPIKAVHARRGKYLRAEPVAALYEQGRVHHVKGLNALEDQQTSWQPGEDSPDRLDAAVYALTELLLQGRETKVA
jgi:phage terminase large subunit-like protein